MDELAQARRDVWRLAMLLTGSAGAADQVLLAALSRRADPRRLSESRLRRAVVHRARAVVERDPDAGFHRLPEPLGSQREAFDRLERTAAEAWLLTQVEGLTVRETTFALGVATTPLERMLDEARGMLGPGPLTEIRTQLDQMAVEREPVLARLIQAQTVRRRIVAGVQTVCFLAVLGLIGYILYDLSFWEHRERERDNAAAEFSVPLPQDAPAPSEGDGP